MPDVHSPTDPPDDELGPLDEPPTPLDSTRVLLHHIHSHDRWAERAREILFGRYRPRLEAWVRRRLSGGGPLLGGSDIVQMALVRAFKGIESFEFRGEGSFLAWLRTIAVRAMADGKRGSAWRVQGGAIPEDLPDREPSPVEALIGADLLKRFEAEVQKLPVKQRDAVLLWAEFGMKPPEIAQEMGIQTSAARMNLLRGLRTLAKKLGVDLDRHR